MRSEKRPRYILAVWVLLAATLIGTSTSAQAATASLVGKLPRIPPEVRSALGPSVEESGFANIQGLVTLVPSRRLLVQSYQVTDTDGLPGMALWVRNLDTFKTVKVIKVAASFSEVDRTTFTALDDKRGRLFYADASLSSGGNGYVTLDLEQLTATSTPYPSTVVKIYKSGVTYDSRTDRLYMVSATTCGGMTGCPGAMNVLSAVKASSGELEYQRPLRACRGTMPVEFAETSDPAIRVLSVQDKNGVYRLHIPCWLRQEVSGVVVVEADNPHATGESFIAGPPQMAQFYTDFDGGRIVFVGRPGSGVQEEGFVYDAKASAFVGAMGITIRGARSGYGLDPETGVFFGINNIGGLLSSQIRLDPIPQPEDYRGYPAGYGSSRVWYDPLTSRLFVLKDFNTPEDPLRFNRNASYDVVSIPRPLPVPPSQDPDRYTADIVETADTRAAYAANGSGYGLRILVARGIQGAVPTSGDSLNLPALIQNDYTPNKCGFSDRTIVLGLVGTPQGPVSLTDTGAGARAAEIEVDDATKVDLESPSRCDQMILPRLEISRTLDMETGILSNGTVRSAGVPSFIDQSLGKPWGYRPAECSGTGSNQSETTDDATPIGSARVQCDSSSETIVASSNGRIDLAGISVADTLTTLNIKRKLGEGATVVMQSVVRGIQMGDLAIGEVRTVATSHSGGRPGTASASFAREIRGLILPGGVGPISCRNEGCESYLNSMNAALAGRAEFRFPPPDDSLCRARNVEGRCSGTPRGAQAGILKSDFRRASDKAMSGDASREIPGLELLVYNDNQWSGRARQLIQLAGVQASTSYNISALQEGSGFAPAGLTSFFEEVPFEELAFEGVGQIGEEPVGLFKRFIRKVIKPIAEGLILLFASPRDAVRSATAWALLGAPVIMAIRRRRLLDLNRSN